MATSSTLIHFSRKIIAIALLQMGAPAWVASCMILVVEAGESHKQKQNIKEAKALISCLKCIQEIPLSHMFVVDFYE